MSNDDNRKGTNVIRLADGRQLGYAEYGVPDGKPIFEFHSTPSSRLGARLFDEAARRFGSRVIGIDRPRNGPSDYKPRRKLLDWPDDVFQVAEALNIDRFSIVGGSVGVPSVLACASKIPERLTSVGVLFGPHAPGATDRWSPSRRIQVFLARNGALWISRLAMSARKLKVFKDRITIVPGATNHCEVIQRAIEACDGVLTRSAVSHEMQH